MQSHDTILSALYAQWPRLHGDSGQDQWSLPPAVLDWIAKRVTPGCHTLETGCGYSTIMFAASGCHHTVISPIAAEHVRIRRWGESHGVDFRNVSFIASKSEDVLPTLRSPPLSLALIDGWHAFPGPFLDWFFVSRLLAVNGIVVVDDVQLRACRLLRDFLRAETGRWRLVAEIARAEMFEKLTNDLFVGDWNTQPFGSVPIRTASEIFQDRFMRPLSNIAKRVPGMRAVVGLCREFSRGRRLS
jgi:hypothetical protein